MQYRLHYGHHRAIAILALAKSGALGNEASLKTMHIGHIGTKDNWKRLFASDLVDLFDGKGKYTSKRLRSTNTAANAAKNNIQTPHFQLFKAERIANNFSRARLHQKNPPGAPTGVVVFAYSGAKAKEIEGRALLEDVQDYYTFFEKKGIYASTFIQNFTQPEEKPKL